MAIVTLLWQDVVDILLLGFLLHRIALILYRADALSILFVILGLYGMQLAAQEMGLILTGWFFEIIRPLIVIILVVVFRNELREMVLRTKPLRLLIGREEGVGMLNLRSLSRELFALARDRIGALVVLGRGDSLLGHVQGGLVLDSRFDARLLRSIFLKESPVHDGAVLLEGGRIVRVGALLPLSLRSDLPDDYGTRHRAALGLSERTDAVILVASEERGEVTVVHRGESRTPGDEAELEGILRRLCEQSPRRVDPRSWALAAGRQLLGFSGVCLLVAVFWGLYFGQQQVMMITVPARVDYRNIPPGLVLEDVSHESIEVQISGREVFVDSLERDRVRVSVDLAGEVAGLNKRIPLMREDVEPLPPGLRVDQISPSRIRVDLVHRVEEVLPIEPRIVGAPPEGFRVSSYVVDPPAIAVGGPETVFRSREAYATTEIVDLRRAKPQEGIFVAEPRVQVYPASIQPSPGAPEKVRVQIRLTPAESAPRAPEPEAPGGTPEP